MSTNAFSKNNIIISMMEFFFGSMLRKNIFQSVGNDKLGSLSMIGSLVH